MMTVKCDFKSGTCSFDSSGKKRDVLLNCLMVCVATVGFVRQQFPDVASSFVPALIEELISPTVFKSVASVDLAELKKQLEVSDEEE